MKSLVSRAAALVALVLAGTFTWAAPAHAAAMPQNCWVWEEYSTYTQVQCRYTSTYGYTYPDYIWLATGSFHLDMNFSSSGQQIWGSRIEVRDNVTPSGAGVVVQLNAHKRGRPVDNNPDNYLNLGAYKDSTGWHSLPSAYWSNGIDFVYINYADSHSGCPYVSGYGYCYRGTHTLYNPNVGGVQ